MCKLYGDGIHDDTEAIQMLLDRKGEVKLPQPEKFYLISKALEIGSNTSLILPRFAEIRLAPMSDSFMLKNKTVHKKDEDDSIGLPYVEVRYYRFLKNFSPKAEDRVENIEVIGGIWNYNNKQQRRNPMETRDYGPNGDYTGAIFLFYNVKNLHFGSMTFKNPITYCTLMDRLEYFTIDHINFDFNDGNPRPINMDGIHCNGNCHHGMISDLKGACYDDLVALNADEGSCGPITNVVVKGIFAEDCHSAVRLLTRGCEVKNIHISDVFGTYYQYCIGLTRYHESDEKGFYDAITLDHIYASKAVRHSIYGKDGTYEYPLIFIEKNSHIKNLKISELHREEKVRALDTIYVGENTLVENLILEDIVTDNHTKEPEMRVLSCDGKISRLFAANIRVNGKEIKLS